MYLGKIEANLIFYFVKGEKQGAYFVKKTGKGIIFKFIHTLFI